MEKLRSFNLEQAVTAASTALSRVAGTPITVDAAQNLENGARRNLIARARAVGKRSPTQSIIIKATRSAFYDPNATDAFQTSGFVKEWEAATYLARHSTSGLTEPRLLAADLLAGVLVYEDLGEGVPSLVEPLLHGTETVAERWLVAYAKALAALHGATIGCRAEHAAVLLEGYPATVIPPPAHRWIETVARMPFAKLGGAFPDDEAGLIAERLRNPGCWQALVHGDPCPDNILLGADERAILIDFKFARPGHALLDAAYWRMGFPTCWCAGTVPAWARSRIERAYRDAIADAVPAARDDEHFRREIAIIDAAWLLGNLAWLLDGALAEDRVWGRAPNRARIMTYLDTFIRSAEEADVLPSLREAAAGWRHGLTSRWPAAARLFDFPSFCVP